MISRRSAAAGMALLAATWMGAAHAQETKLTVIVFPGVQNLPMFAAQAKGFYAKRGLAVDLKFTPNSDELRNGLAEGRYQIAHSAVDNAFALKDKANVDIAVVFGGDDSFNRLIVQPEINSLADLKGKTVAVDALNTAYAFQLYEMLRQKGLNKGDYEVKSVGGTGQRMEALTKDKTYAAAIMNPPFSIRAEKAGLKSLGTVADAIGAYQGSAAFVLRSWGAANTDALVKYAQAYIEGHALDAQSRQQGRGGGAARGSAEAARGCREPRPSTRRSRASRRTARSTWTACATCSSCARSSRAARRPIRASTST